MIVDFYGLDLPIPTSEVAEADVLTALTNAVDANSIGINATVVSAFDATILDSIMAHPTADLCPFVGINTWIAPEVVSQGGRGVHVPYNLSLYFIYEFGTPAADPNYSAHNSFVIQRNRHLLANMRSLVMQSGGNTNAKIPATHGWKWSAGEGSKRIYDFFAPFRYLNESYQLKGGYNCVRVDCPIDPW